MNDEGAPKNESVVAQKCVDCGAVSPPAHTNYTLISAKHGWRLSFVTDKDGRKVGQWRCPGCWNARKPKKG